MSANLMSLARSGGKFLKLFGDRKMMKTMPTARDYVQDGLIAMWDGIENAGWGVHDENATELVDLMRNFPSLSISYCQGNEAVIATNITPYIKPQTFTENWGTGHPYTHEVLYRTESFTTTDFIPHIINESYPYRQDNFFLWPILVAQSGNINKIWCKTSGYSPSVQTGGLHTITMSNPATILEQARMYLNGSSNLIDGYVTTGKVTPRHRVSLAAVAIKYSFYYGCIRFYSRALTAEEIVHNYAIDKARFNLPD